MRPINATPTVTTGITNSSPISVTSTATTGITNSNPIPIFAYYYIWFDPSSWAKDKIDYPLLGHYRSDDPAVIRQHIEWAKGAGIRAFIVSWKSTDKLDPRLEQLIEIAKEEDFKLAINYEGLDEQRNPLPITQIAADFDYFIAHYANQSVFNVYNKPLVIWSGTWKFSAQDIATVTQNRRDKLLILASDRDVAGYQRLASLVDGDAYYFSSVDPDTFPAYLGKLTAMGRAIHSHGGLWIAPAAPGFDSRLLGGTTVVDRKDGATLRTEFNVAMQSSPDAIGLISWNEFSENSYIEPSINYGKRYLDVLTSITQAQVPATNNFDSSDPGSGPEAFAVKGAALGIVVVLVVFGLIVVARRHG